MNRTAANGWTAWLDIAAEGGNKATAIERVRIELNGTVHEDGLAQVLATL